MGKLTRFKMIKEIDGNHLIHVFSIKVGLIICNGTH